MFRVHTQHNIASFLLSLLNVAPTPPGQRSPSLASSAEDDESAKVQQTESERLMELLTTQNAEMSKLRSLLAEKDARISDLLTECEALRQFAQDADTQRLVTERNMAIDNFRFLRHSSLPSKPK